MIDGLALIREAAGPIGHDSLALGSANRGAEVGLARGATLALAAFGRVERNDVIALLQRAHAGPDIHDHARTLVPEDRRKQPFRVGARERVLVGVADPGGLHFDQYFARLRALKLHPLNTERLAGLERHRGTYVHDLSP